MAKILAQNVLTDIFKTSIDDEGVKLMDNLRKAFPNSNIPDFKTNTDWQFNSNKSWRIAR